MKKLFKLKLETLREFQIKFPTSHVGGSIGLFLRGIDLKRDLVLSDLDITIDDIESGIPDNYEPRNSGNDFDFAVVKQCEDGYYVKIDIRVNPEPSFDIINFEGVNYNVSKYRDIIFWKSKYADKGIKKHIFDLQAIKTGERPLEKVDGENILPF